MTNFIRSLRALCVGIVAFIVGQFGWIGWLIIVYACTIVLDYVTGTISAIKTKTWTSALAREGIWHKIGCITTIGVAGLADWMLAILMANSSAIHGSIQYDTLLCPIVLVWYIITEFGSILENAEKLNARIPTFLKAIIKSAKNAVEELIKDKK